VEEKEAERYPPEHLIDFIAKDNSSIHESNFGGEFVIRQAMKLEDLERLEPGVRFRFLVEKGITTENGVEYPFKVTFFNMNQIGLELEHLGSDNDVEYITIPPDLYLYNHIEQLADNGAIFTLRANGHNLFSLQLFPPGTHVKRAEL
jgi:hypothetical protein